MFRQSADWGMSMPSEGRVRGVLGRDAPRGSSCLPCRCRRRQRAAFRGIFGLGDMTPRLSFFPGGGLCGRTSASARGGVLRRVGSVRKERKLGAPEAPRLGRRCCGAGTGSSAGRSLRSMRAGGKESEPCGRALPRGAGGLPDAFRRRAGVRQKTRFRTH